MLLIEAENLKGMNVVRHHKWHRQTFFSYLSSASSKKMQNSGNYWKPSVLSALMSKNAVNKTDILFYVCATGCLSVVGTANANECSWQWPLSMANACAHYYTTQT